MTTEKSKDGGWSLLTFRKSSFKDVIASLLLVLAALPAVRPIPMDPSRNEYGREEYPAEPQQYSYVEPPQHPYDPYQPPPLPVYEQYQPPPPPPPPTLPPPPPPQNYVQYNAITYQELNTSYHCGVIPDTNFELYRKSSDPYEVADVVPYGKFPWIALILYNNKVICQGTLIHYNFIITSSQCLSEYNSLEKYELRLGDWDILTDHNEYEAYSDRELRICTKYELGNSQHNYKGESYGGESAYKANNDLIIIKTDTEPNYDKQPHVKPICLPKLYSSSLYNSEGYDAGDQFSPYSVCWVAGWYGSESTKLQNHAQPEMADEEYHASYHKGYSHNYQKYYKGVEYSMIQKRAKVKQISCQSYGRYGFNSNYGPSSVCFVGVDGYDACVAEKGAAIFCVVEEAQDYGAYDSGVYEGQQLPQYGHSGYDPYYHDFLYESYNVPVVSSLHPGYKTDSSYGHGPYYKTPIQAIPSPSKPNRYRAILYAVIQKPTKCGKGYSNSYNRMSLPIVATRVDHETVSGIVNAVWTNAYDHSCPVTNAKYKPVQKQESYSYSGGGYSGSSGRYKSVKSSYYFGNYRYSRRGKGGYSYKKNPRYNY